MGYLDELFKKGTEYSFIYATVGPSIDARRPIEGDNQGSNLDWTLKLGGSWRKVFGADRRWRLRIAPEFAPRVAQDYKTLKVVNKPADLAAAGYAPETAVTSIQAESVRRFAFQTSLDTQVGVRIFDSLLIYGRGGFVLTPTWTTNTTTLSRDCKKLKDIYCKPNESIDNPNIKNDSEEVFSFRVGLGLTFDPITFFSLKFETFFDRLAIYGGSGKQTFVTRADVNFFIPLWRSSERLPKGPPKQMVVVNSTLRTDLTVPILDPAKTTVSLQPWLGIYYLF